MLLFGPFICIYIICITAIATTSGFSDHLESSTVVITQQWMHGRQLYHTAASPNEYSMLYGPAIFLSVASALFVSPDSPIIASKLSGGLWSLLALVFLAYALKKKQGSTAAWVGTGLVTAQVFYFPLFYLCGVRSDGIIFAMTCLGLCGLVSGRIAGGTLIAVSLAIALDCKLHGFIYSVPILMVWFRRHGLQLSILLVGFAAVLSFLPFLLPNISLSNYLFWLHMAAKHPRSNIILMQNVGSLLIILAPIALLVSRIPVPLKWDQAGEESILLLGLVIGGLVVTVIASKEGAGSHHLLPFLPYVGYLFCACLHTLPKKPELNWGICLSLLLLFYLLSDSVFISRYTLKGCQLSNAKWVQADLLQILRKYAPQEVQMGAGGNDGYGFTLEGPLVYRSGQPCVLNIGSFMDMKESGLTDGALSKSLTQEQFRYWLTPKGEPPFSMDTGYANKPLFDDGVVKAFEEHYNKVDSSQFFDVYQAKRGMP